LLDNIVRDATKNNRATNTKLSTMTEEKYEWE